MPVRPLDLDVPLDSTYAIVQTGRLGDLWFTVPLADHLSRNGNAVEIWYDRSYGNPFEYFPSVSARPTRILRPIPSADRLSNIANAAAGQVLLYGRVRMSGRRTIWNQIYPLRVGAYLRNEPYPASWYRRLPHIDYRSVTTTLPIANDRTILFFAASLSLRIEGRGAYDAWLEANLEILRARTGYRVVYVPPPGQPDHSRYETWRGDLNAYQRLIARCGIVFGISTSAHVLGQLLGKPVIACYRNRKRQIDTIGNETARLYPGDLLEDRMLDELGASLRRATNV